MRPLAILKSRNFAESRLTLSILYIRLGSWNTKVQMGKMHTLAKVLIQDLLPVRGFRKPRARAPAAVAKLFVAFANRY